MLTFNHKLACSAREQMLKIFTMFENVEGLLNVIIIGHTHNGAVHGLKKLLMLPILRTIFTCQEDIDIFCLFLNTVVKCESIGCTLKPAGKIYPRIGKNWKMVVWWEKFISTCF